MFLKELLLPLCYLKTTGLACVVREHNSKCLSLRVILFCLTAGLAIFDGYTHWKVWLTIRESGLSHPLIRIPSQWTEAWLVFTCIGTGSACLYITNELSGVVAFYREYSGKTRADPCLPCKAVGLNFITRSEILTLLNISLEDLPLLVLSLMFAAAQYSCNHPTPSENLSILNFVFISSLASLLHVGWCVIRFLFYLVLRAYAQRCARAKSNNNTRQPTTTTKELVAESEGMRRKMKEKEVELAELENVDSKFQTRQLYALKCCKMKCCVVCHTVILMVVCSLTIVISTTAIVLAKDQDFLTETFFLDPSKQLGIYRTYPQEQILVNASTIINSKGIGVCLQEKFTNQPTDESTVSCSVVFVYNANEGQIHYNYDGGNEHNAYNCSGTLDICGTMPTSAEICEEFYKELFLGHHIEEGGVRRFKDTCLGVLILPDNGALLQRQETLPVNCTTPLPMT